MGIQLRPLVREDLTTLGRWLAEPHVCTWWREASDPTSVRATYAPAIAGADPTELLIAELDGRPIGMLQRYLLSDNPDYERALAPAQAPSPAASLDYLIGVPELTGRGLGPRMIAAGSSGVWLRHPEVVAIVVAVQQANRPSWRALESAGYRRTWAGAVASGDPSDEGSSYVYVLDRPLALSTLRMRRPAPTA
ncbi:MAG: GNAT family N-acetyltransferase [Solirubrobacterales bacterium]|nr:GNAT family N-acetyltransferase [Solirubrobacterales bacterium]